MSERHSALCMPILRRPVHLTVSTITQAWHEVWPQLSLPVDVDLKDDAFTFVIDGVQVGGMVIPAPVPNDGLAGPASTAWLWPKASEELRGYEAHVILFVSQADSHLKAFQVLTRSAAAIVRATNALGVYMGGAEMVIRGDLFVDMAQEMTTPVALWVDLRCVALSNGRNGLFTVGLKQFGLMEVEIPSSVQKCGDLRMWTMSLASWIIETRPTIHPGETVGLSAEQRLPVEHAPSMVDREGPVMRLTGL